MRRQPTLLVCAFVILAGCGQSETRPTYEVVPVGGKVMVAGTPLEDGMIMFHPDQSKGNDTEARPMGRIQRNGTFELLTNTQPGAPTGWYKVTVAVMGVPMVEKGKAPPRFHSKYSDPQQTDLSVEVVPNADARHYELTLSKP